MNLNSGTHEQINQPVSRQDAKAQKGRERRGNLAGKQETAGKQEESRFNHRGSPRGTEGERKRGRGEGDNIQYPIFNVDRRQTTEVHRGGRGMLGPDSPTGRARGGLFWGFNIASKGHQIPMVKLLPKWFWIPPSETSFFR